MHFIALLSSLSSQPGRSYQHPMDRNDSKQQYNRKNTIHIADESALNCKNNCGFFGNREWDGYCSFCYKHRRDSLHQATSTAAANTSLVDSIMKPQINLPSGANIFAKKLLPDMLTRAQSAASLSNNSPSFKYDLFASSNICFY